MTENSRTPQILGNSLYFICTVCGPKAEDALLYASRTDGPFEHCAEKRVAEKFFKRHELCGGTRDHFRLGMLRMADLDAPVDPATNIKGAVKLALVKS
jgi:hypothetical protein